MSLQEIQLEKNDDLASICDKVDGLNCSRIILICPDGSTGLSKRLDMVLLQRYAQATGTRVALVTKEATIRAESKIAGLPAYRSVKAARRAKWRATHTRHQVPISPRYSTLDLNIMHDGLISRERMPLQPILLRVFLFAIGVAAVLGLAAYILMTTYIIL